MHRGRSWAAEKVPLVFFSFFVLRGKAFEQSYMFRIIGFNGIVQKRKRRKGLKGFLQEMSQNVTKDTWANPDKKRSDFKGQPSVKSPEAHNKCTAIMAERKPDMFQWIIKMQKVCWLVIRRWDHAHIWHLRRGGAKTRPECGRCTAEALAESLLRHEAADYCLV